MQRTNHLLYSASLAKYKKFKSRYLKNIKNGRFYQLSVKKRSQIISRLKRLFARLQQLKFQLKIAAATGVLSIALNNGQLNAQQLGPFVENKRDNPFRPSPSFLANRHPAVVDIDKDGDLDVFVGTTYNSIIFLKNEGTATAPFFVKQLYTANPLDGVYADNGTPTFADLDKDGDFDLIMGQRYVYQFTPSSDPRLIFLENTGDAYNPVFTPPSGEHPVDNIFADAYYAHPSFADIDNDGDLDAFIGSDRLPFNVYYENREAIKFWRNDGSLPVAQFTEENGSTNPIAIANQEFGGTVDRAAPVLVDIDNDGDYDMFVGDRNTTVRFFPNTGTITAPIFASESAAGSNPFYGIYFTNSASPEFADFDDDGDFDVIVGGDYNTLRFFENIGTPSSPQFVERKNQQNPFDGLTLGNYITPTIADVDGDSFDDLVIGSSNDEEIYYYKNNQDGTFIKQEGTDNFFQGLLGSNYYNPSPALVDIDDDGDLDLFAAVYGNDFVSRILFFRQDASNSFIQESSSITITYGGNKSYGLTMGDFDQDGNYDAIIGTYRVDDYSTSFQFIKNTGTASSPSFVRQDLYGAPFNGIELDAIYGVYPKPTLVDLDHDGDLDVVAGEHSPSIISGNIVFFQNTGGILTQQLLGQNPFYNLNGGRDSYPAFLDVDNDGDLDLLIGNKYGEISFMENQNIPPQVNHNPSGLTFTEDGPVLDIAAALALSDDTNDDGIGAVVAITNFVDGEDVLSFTPQFGITGSFNSASGVLTLSGSAKLAEYELVLQSVTYANTSQSPNAVTRAIQFSVTDYDATDPFSDSFPEPIISVDVIPVNDLPILVASVGSITFTENDAATVIDAGLTVADIDNTNLQSATISITTNFNQAEDALVFTTQNGITGNYVSSTGILTLSGTSSVANYQAALRSVSYINSSDDPSTSTRTIEFSVFDGTDNSAVGTKDINVASVNDAPQLFSENTGTNESYTQNAAAVVIDALIDISDADDTNLVGATVTINGLLSGDNLIFTDQNGITGAFASGILTLSGTSSLANYRTALGSVSFMSSNGTGTRTIDFIVDDGNDVSVAYSRTINITGAGNQPPVVNTTPATTQVGGVVTINWCDIIEDPDNDDSELTIEVVSTSSGAQTNIVDCDLSIDYTGLSFSGTDLILIRATDPDGNSDENTLIIDVEQVVTPAPPVLPLQIYNAISPNGDGLNDWWEIVNLLTPNTIKLYNRWGDLVKTLTDYANVPDNTLLNDLPSGTYFYKIESPNGEHTGYISIKK